MNHYNKLWVEKYRPKTLDDIILEPEIKEHFKTITEDIPSILLYGPPGGGKSTLAKIVVNDLLKCQYLYINASDENGVDTIRNKVINFAQTRSIDSKKKIIILDEADGLTGESLRILRNVMEEYIDTTRFILTANYLNRIIEPVRSRCVLFRLQPTIKACGYRCLEILERENITFDSDVMKSKFSDFLNDRYPDMRRIVNDLQRFSITGTLVFPEEKEISGLCSWIVFTLIQKSSSLEIRKKIIESEKCFNNDYQELMKNIFDYVYNSSLPENTKKIFLLNIGEYMYRDNFVLDHEINFFCCILAIESSI